RFAGGDLRDIMARVELARRNLAAEPESRRGRYPLGAVVGDDVVFHESDDAPFRAVSAPLGVADDEIAAHFDAAKTADADAAGSAALGVVAGDQVVLDQHGPVG